MCSEQPWVQPNAADPTRDETGVLPRRHALPRPTPPDEQKLATFPAGSMYVVINRLAGLFGHLEPNRLAGLPLPDRRSIDGVSTWGNILDLEGDDITAA